MIKMHELRELIKLIDYSSIDELELKNESMYITLKKEQSVEEPAPLQDIPVTAILETAYQEVAASIATNEAPIEEITNYDIAVPSNVLQEIQSNWVGIFTSSVQLGDQVKKGQVVCSCHVDMLKLSHDIPSPVSGEIVDILVEDGQFIDYGQELFVVKVIQGG